MKTNLTFPFIFTLFIIAISAVSTLDQIWEVDESCDGKRKELDAAFSDVRKMVMAARRDLFRIQEKKPDRKSSGPLGDYNWNRIARNMAVVFGLAPPHDMYQSGYNTTNEHLQRVNYTIGRLWGGIVQGDALPERGFSNKLRELNKKPLIMCGDSTGTYRAKLQPDLYEKSKNIMKVFPGVNEKKDDGTYKYSGAWIHKHRYIGAGPFRSPVICPPEQAILGVTNQKLDMITFCDDVFKFNANQSALRNASDIRVGLDIDDSGIATKSIARVMLHEFAHYYGTKPPSNENGELSDEDKLSDKTAIDKNGCVLYYEESTGTFLRENPGGALTASKVYGMAFVASIARNSTGNDNWGMYRRDRSRPNEWSPCEFTNFSGEAVAPYTAETYAYFGILSYLDQWDFTPDGVAKKVPRRKEFRLPGRL